jgi:hypothetical protein
MIPYRFCGLSIIMLVGGVELPFIAIETLAGAVKDILQRRMTNHDSIDEQAGYLFLFRRGAGMV